MNDAACYRRTPVDDDARHDATAAHRRKVNTVDG
jgi:hypothetical protein